MRITERMGLVYTALFLMVSVAVITQNSDTLMAKFRGQDNVLAVEDIYTVQAGRDQRLFVLRNDVLAARVRPEMIRLLTRPNCGTVRQVGGSFLYENSAACSGRQEFSYCLDTGAECRPARVMLRLIEPRDPISTIQTGPVTDLAGLGTQEGMNRQDLEISNVHLGREMQAERGAGPVARPASGMKLAAVAADPLPRLLPGDVDKAGRPDALARREAAEAAVPAAPGKPDAAVSEEAVQVAAVTPRGPTATDAVTEPPGAKAGPETGTAPRAPALVQAARPLTPPRDPGAGGLPPITAPGPDSRIATAAPAADPQAVRELDRLDRNPFGTGDCRAEMRLRPLSDARVALQLTAPCAPNRRVEILHGRMIVAEVTDHTGRLRVVLPALERRARFLVRFPSGRRLAGAVSVTGLEGLERSVVMWRGAAEIDLHALEDGAAPGSAGDVWRGNPRDPRSARKAGGGYLMVLGDPRAPDPLRAQVYTVPADPARPRPQVALTVTATEGSCGRPLVLRSLRARGGRMIAASGLRMVLPRCDADERSVVLQNLLGDMIIAGN